MGELRATCNADDILRRCMRTIISMSVDRSVSPGTMSRQFGAEIKKKSNTRHISVKGLHKHAILIYQAILFVHT